MFRVSLALSLLFLTSAVAAAQSPAKRNSAESVRPAADPISRAILALKQLDQDVVVYRSLGDFEAGGKLAEVPLRKFQEDFELASSEIAAALVQIPTGKLRIDLINALDSYRDGLFWWRQVDHPKVIHVSALARESSSIKSDANLLSTIPYTVAIHWRQAHKYLVRAEQTQSRER